MYRYACVCLRGCSNTAEYRHIATTTKHIPRPLTTLSFLLRLFLISTFHYVFHLPRRIKDSLTSQRILHCSRIVYVLNHITLSPPSHANRYRKNPRMTRQFGNQTEVFPSIIDCDTKLINEYTKMEDD